MKCHCKVQHTEAAKVLVASDTAVEKTLRGRGLTPGHEPARAQAYRRQDNPGSGVRRL